MNNYKIDKSIKTKIVTQVSTLIVLILVIFNGYILYRTVYDLKNRADTDLQNRTKNLAYKVEQRLNSLQESTELLATNELLINAFIDKQYIETYLKPLVNNFKNEKSLDSLALVDFDGRVVFKTDENILKYNESKELQLALNLTQNIVYFDKDRDEIVFIIPLKYYSTVQGAIIANYNLKDIIALYDENENYIYTKFLKNSYTAYSKDYEKNESYYKYELLDNSNYEILHKIGVTLEMGIVESVYLKPLKKEALSLVLFALLILIIGALISYYFATTIVNPILKLYNQIKQASSEQQDIYEPLGTDDELDALGYMYYLKEKELKELNKNLELKIKEATKELEIEKNRFLLAIEGAQDGIWDWEIDKDKVYLSKRWKQMLGFEEDELKSESKIFFNHIHKDDQKMVELKLQKHFEDPLKFPYFVEIRMLCKDGTYKWILARGQASLNHDGTPHRMVGSHTDISIQKNLEFKLLEQRNFNRSLVYSANSIIAVINRDGVMIDINPFGERFSGYTKEEIASEPFFWARLLPKDIQPKVLEIIEIAKQGQIAERVQNSWISKDGVEKVFEWSNAIIYDANGVMEYVTTIGVDISQIKEQEKELIEAKDFAEKATAAKSDFLANMSHEIRTPLNGIIGLSNLVLETDLNEVQKNYINKSIASSKALLHIINDILDYSKIEAGKIEIEHIPFELDATLSQVSNLFTYETQKKGIELSFITTPVIKDTLIGDPFRISQILINLIGNALKFTHRGFIHVTTSMENISDDTLKLKFEIKDSGIGISQEKQVKLFQKFSQVDTSNTREYGGSGLGLSISQKLAQLMGGDISLQSQEGEGSTFSFSVIVGYAKRECEVFSHDLKNSEDIRNKKIYAKGKVLLVEDNEINQLVAKNNLEHFGLEVFCAVNGKEGVEKAKESRFDIIFMDLQMPIMDGYQATKLIREFDKEIPIIALSAAAMKSDVKLTQDIGMNEHLAKPIDVHELKKVIIKYLENNFIAVEESVQGINLEDLFARFSNDKNLAYKTLVGFSKDKNDIVQIIDSLNPDSKEFDKFIHNLKGISGNLSLYNVFKCCNEIYRTNDLEDKIKLLPNLKESLTVVLKAIDENIVPKLQNNNETKQYTKNELLSNIETIAKEIEVRRFIEQERVDMLINQVKELVDTNTAAELSGYLSHFDYKNADVLLKKIKGVLS